MKKTIKVNGIYKNGTESETIFKAIANMNEKNIEFSPRDLEGYFKFQSARYPAVPVTLIKGEEPNCYHVSEDGGKTFTLSLEWAEIYELVHDSEGENGAGC